MFKYIWTDKSLEEIADDMALDEAYTALLPEAIELFRRNNASKGNYLNEDAHQLYNFLSYANEKRIEDQTPITFSKRYFLKWDAY